MGAIAQFIFPRCPFPILQTDQIQFFVKHLLVYREDTKPISKHSDRDSECHEQPGDEHEKCENAGDDSNNPKELTCNRDDDYEPNRWLKFSWNFSYLFYTMIKSQTLFSRLPESTPALDATVRSTLYTIWKYGEPAPFKSLDVKAVLELKLLFEDIASQLKSATRILANGVPSHRELSKCYFHDSILGLIFLFNNLIICQNSYLSQEFGTCSEPDNHEMASLVKTCLVLCLQLLNNLAVGSDTQRKFLFVHLFNLTVIPQNSMVFDPLHTDDATFTRITRELLLDFVSSEQLPHYPILLGRNRAWDLSNHSPSILYLCACLSQYIGDKDKSLGKEAVQYFVNSCFAQWRSLYAYQKSPWNRLYFEIRRKYIDRWMNLEKETDTVPSVTYESMNHVGNAFFPEVRLKFPSDCISQSTSPSLEFYKISEYFIFTGGRSGQNLFSDSTPLPNANFPDPDILLETNEFLFVSSHSIANCFVVLDAYVSKLENLEPNKSLSVVSRVLRNVMSLDIHDTTEPFNLSKIILECENILEMEPIDSELSKLNHFDSLLADITKTLTPDEHMPLASLLFSTILKSGSTADTFASTTGPSYQNWACNILLGRKEGIKLLGDMLVWVVVIDMDDRDLYFEILLRIIREIIDIGGLPILFNLIDRFSSKIIPKAWVGLLRILLAYFKSYDYPSSHVLSDNRHHHMFSVVCYLLTEFRSRISPRVYALIKLQSCSSWKKILSNQDREFMLQELTMAHQGLELAIEIMLILLESKCEFINDLFRNKLAKYKFTMEFIKILSALNTLPTAKHRFEFRKPSKYELTEPLEDSISHFPWKNTKKIIISVLTNLMAEISLYADEIGQLGGIDEILSCCNYDHDNSFIREHAYLCLRFALRNSKANQAYVKSLEALEVACSDVFDGTPFEASIESGSLKFSRRNQNIS